LPPPEKVPKIYAKRSPPYAEIKPSSVRCLIGPGSYPPSAINLSPGVHASFLEAWEF
jgi:hypothetical protein